MEGEWDYEMIGCGDVVEVKEGDGRVGSQVQATRVAVGSFRVIGCVIHRRTNNN